MGKYSLGIDILKIHNSRKDEYLNYYNEFTKYFVYEKIGNLSVKCLQDLGSSRRSWDNNKS